jgi:undecaprenyl diphosphate synthase
MDGNRRHAKKNNMQLFKGHEDGAESLKKCLLYCLELDVKIASFYCFSI